MPQELAVWDLTVAFEENPKDHVFSVFRKISKKFCFQLEKGDETGYLHWQCRISLFKKKTFRSLRTILFEHDIEKYHLSVSSNNSRKGDAFYCMKEDTRVEGPYTDVTGENISLKTVVKMDDNGLLPWQNDLMNQVSFYDDRTIHVVVDREGNNGKSALLKWVYSKKLGQPIPPMNSCEDVVQFVYSMPNAKLYLIDLPRAMKKKSLFSMYSGIECIKNGMLYDKRYKGVFKYIDEPNIIVFTNTAPKLRYLSKDRWKLWTVQDGTLQIFRYPARPIKGVISAD